MSFVTAIDCLLFSGSPTAVSSFVVAVGIGKAVKTRVGRTRSHISNKLFKIVPPLAELDAPATVTFPCVMLSIFATITSRAPAFVFPIPARMTVDSVMSGFSFTGSGMSKQPFSIQAAATLRWAFSLWGVRVAAQIAAFNYCFVAAIAKANPFRSFWNNWQMPAKYNQSSYALST